MDEKKEITHVKNSSYARYEELLMRRDNVQKEAFQWDKEYIRVFGDKILKIFELKLTCIRKKKAISYCQAVANHGGVVDQYELQKYLEKEMAAYQAELEAMIRDNEAAKNSQEIPEIEVLEIKKIYRRLAKKLHPDINPNTSKVDELIDLWGRISVAYKCNSLKDMKELEVLAMAALKSLGKSGNIVDIPDIDEKIKELEAEIDKIRSTDPYMYRFILEDVEAINAKNSSLIEEYTSYEDYDRQLDDILQGLMEKGMSFTWRMN